MLPGGVARPLQRFLEVSHPANPDARQCDVDDVELARPSCIETFFEKPWKFLACTFVQTECFRCAEGQNILSSGDGLWATVAQRVHLPLAEGFQRYALATIGAGAE